MKFRVDKIDEVHVFRLDEDRLDNTISAEFKAELLRKIEKEKVQKLLIDLQNVDYVDSSGLGALLFGHRQARQHSGDMKLVHGGPKVKTLIRIGQLEKILVAFDSEQEALRSF